MTNDTPDTTPDNPPENARTIAVTTEPGAEGWTTTRIAGTVLSRDQRTVKRLLTPAPEPLTEAKPIWGRKVKQGRQRPWEVDIATLQRLVDRWVAEGKLEEAEASAEIPAGGYEEADRAGSVQRAYETIARELASAAERAATAETRLEITERAESSVREDLDAERRRREAAERERDEERRERQRAVDELEAERSKGFFRRLFGG